METYEKVVQQVDKLSIVEKVRLLEHCSAAVKHDLEVEAYKHIPWEEFVRTTYGIMTDDPIERNQPPHPDVRNEIE